MERQPEYPPEYEEDVRFAKCPWSGGHDMHELHTYHGVMYVPKGICAKCGRTDHLAPLNK